MGVYTWMPQGDYVRGTVKRIDRKHGEIDVSIKMPKTKYKMETVKDIPLYADDVCHIWRMPCVSRMLRAPCKGCPYARTLNCTENVCLPKFPYQTAQCSTREATIKRSNGGPVYAPAYVAPPFPLFFLCCVWCLTNRFARWAHTHPTRHRKVGG